MSMSWLDTGNPRQLELPTLGCPPPTASAFLVAVRTRPPDAVTQHFGEPLSAEWHRLAAPHGSGRDESVVSLTRSADGRPLLHVKHYVRTAVHGHAADHLSVHGRRGSSVDPIKTSRNQPATRQDSQSSSVAGGRNGGGSTFGRSASSTRSQQSYGVGGASRPTTPGQRRAVGDTAARATASAVRQTETTFEFDMCFVPPPRDDTTADDAREQPLLFTDSSQRAVHQHVGVPTVEHLLRGYNTCLMAYGQTGSGKTYTMLGPGWDDVQNKWSPARRREARERAELVHGLAGSEERGLMLRTCELLFEKLHECQEDEAVRLEVMRSVWSDLLKDDAGTPSVAALPQQGSSPRGGFAAGGSSNPATAGASRATTPASTPRYHTKQNLQVPAPAVAAPASAAAAVVAGAQSRPHLAPSAASRAQQRALASASRAISSATNFSSGLASQRSNRQSAAAAGHVYHHTGGTGGKSPDDVFGEVIKRSVSQHRGSDGSPEGAGGAVTPDIPPAEYEVAFEARHSAEHRLHTRRPHCWYNASAVSVGQPPVAPATDDSDADDALDVAPAAHASPPSGHNSLRRRSSASTTQSAGGTNRGKPTASTPIPFVSPSKTDISINVSACSDEDEGGESAPNAPLPAVQPQPHPAAVAGGATRQTPAPLQRTASVASAASTGMSYGASSSVFAASGGAAGGCFDPTQYEEEVQILASFYQIYNEKVWCLLRPNNTPLRIREHAAVGTYVEDLLATPVRDFAGLLDAIEIGNRSRRVAATVHNRQSSRSHAVFSVQVQRRLRLKSGALDEDRPGDRPWMHMMSSVLNLVDLAGSERVGGVEGVSAQRWKEATDINSSLTALAKVIQVLSERQRKDPGDRQQGSAAPFVPYRESALTWLLRDCFGGNARTVMVATISPERKDIEETLNTLRYSSRARRIVNRPVVNGQSAKNQAAIIASLQREIIALRAQLTAFTSAPPSARSTTQFHGLPEDVARSVAAGSSSASLQIAVDTEEHLRLKARLEESERLMTQMTSPTRGVQRQTTPRRSTRKEDEVVLTLSEEELTRQRQVALDAADEARKTMEAQRHNLVQVESMFQQAKQTAVLLDEQIVALRKSLEENWKQREAVRADAAADDELDRRLGSSEPLGEIFSDIPATATAVNPGSGANDPLAASNRGHQQAAMQLLESSLRGSSAVALMDSVVQFNTSITSVGNNSSRTRETSLLRGPGQTPAASHSTRARALSPGPDVSPKPGGPGRASMTAATTSINTVARRESIASGAPPPRDASPKGSSGASPEKRVGVRQRSAATGLLGAAAVGRSTSASLLYSDDEDESSSLFRRRPSTTALTRDTSPSNKAATHVADSGSSLAAQQRTPSGKAGAARPGSPKVVDLSAIGNRTQPTSSAAPAAPPAAVDDSIELLEVDTRRRPTPLQATASQQGTSSLSTGPTRSEGGLMPDRHQYAAAPHRDIDPQTERRAAQRLAAHSAEASAGEAFIDRPQDPQRRKATTKPTTPRSVAFIEPGQSRPTAATNQQTTTPPRPVVPVLSGLHDIAQRFSSSDDAQRTLDAIAKRREALQRDISRLDAIIASDGHAPADPTAVAGATPAAAEGHVGSSSAAASRTMRITQPATTPRRAVDITQQAPAPHHHVEVLAASEPASTTDVLSDPRIAPAVALSPFLRKPPGSPAAHHGRAADSPTMSHRRTNVGPVVPPSSSTVNATLFQIGAGLTSPLPPPAATSVTSPLTDDATARAEARFKRLMQSMSSFTQKPVAP